MIEKLLSPKEVSIITGEALMTTYRRIREGQFQAVHLGKKSIRIAESDLKRWLGVNHDDGHFGQ